MKLKLITAVSLLLFCEIIDAQNSENTITHHYFGYEPGFIQLKEMNLIPKVHKGIIHIVTYSFEKTNKNYQSFKFVFGYNNPKTSIERKAENSNDYDKKNGQIFLNYSYNFNILNKKNIYYYLGSMLSYTYSISYYRGWDSHAYWGNYLSLGPNNVLRIELNNNRSWLTSLNFSLIGFYNRPDHIRLYKVEDWSFNNIIKITNDNYTLGLWDNAFQVQFQTEYRFAIFKSKSFAVDYSFHFSRLKSNESNPLLELIHRIGAKIIL